MKTTLFLKLSAILVFTFFNAQAQTTLSHNVDPLTVDEVGLACWITSTNEYKNNHNARVYNLNEFNISGNFIVSAVEFGQGSGNDGKAMEIRIYTSDSEHLTAATLTLIAEEELVLSQANDLSVVTVPISATIPAGSIAVVETFARNEGSSTILKFFPGFNFNGETDFSWVKVPNCGTSVWMITEEFQTNQQYLINLVGEESLGVNDNVLERVALYPNPTEGNFTIDLATNYEAVDVTVSNIIGQQITSSRVENSNKVDLSIDGEAGIYFVTIQTSEGSSKTLKVVKK